MASILDRINKIGGQPTSNQSQIENTLLTGRTGKAGAKRGPRSSRLGESAAIQASNQALAEETISSRLAGLQDQEKSRQMQEGLRLQQEQLDSQSRIFDAQQAGIESEGALQRASQEELSGIQRDSSARSRLADINAKAQAQLTELSAQRDVSLDNLFSEFEYENKKLADRKDASRLEQAGFLLALQDRAYLAEVDRIGKMRNLTDSQAFDEEMTRIVMGDQLKSIIEQMDFDIEQDALSRERQAELAQIDIDSAIAVAQAEISASNQRAMWTGAGSAASGYAKYRAEQEDNE